MKHIKKRVLSGIMALILSVSVVPLNIIIAQATNIPEEHANKKQTSVSIIEEAPFDFSKGVTFEKDTEITAFTSVRCDLSTVTYTDAGLTPVSDAFRTKLLKGSKANGESSTGVNINLGKTYPAGTKIQYWVYIEKTANADGDKTTCPVVTWDTTNLGTQFCNVGQWTKVEETFAVASSTAMLRIDVNEHSVKTINFYLDNIQVGEDSPFDFSQGVTFEKGTEITAFTSVRCDLSTVTYTDAGLTPVSDAFRTKLLKGSKANGESSTGVNINLGKTYPAGTKIQYWVYIEKTANADGDKTTCPVVTWDTTNLGTQFCNVGQWTKVEETFAVASSTAMIRIDVNEHSVKTINFYLDNIQVGENTANDTNTGSEELYFYTDGWSEGLGDPLSYHADGSIKYGGTEQTNAIEGGVFINNTLTNIQLVKLSPYEYKINLQDVNATEGMELVIGGMFFDNEDVVTIKNAVFRYDGQNWKLKPVDKNRVTVTPTFQEGNGKNGFYFVTSSEDPLEYNTGWSFRYSSANADAGGVYVDGILTDVGMAKIAPDRYYVALSDSGIQGSEGKKVVIDAVISNAENIVTFKKTGFIYKDGAWRVDSVGDRNQVTVSVMDDSTNATSGSGVFYFHTTGWSEGVGDPLDYKNDWSVRYAGTNGVKTIEGGVYIDDTVSAAQMAKISPSRYAVIFQDYGIQVTEGMEVEIAGVFYDEQDVVTIERTKFYYDGARWRMDTSAEHENKNKVTVEIQNDRAGNLTSGANGFYFFTSNDPLEYKADWSMKYGPSQTLNGGIYVDGDLTNVYMMKIAEGRYYVALSDVGITAKEGTEVVVDAKIYDDNNVVTFKKAIFNFDGTMWTVDTSAQHAHKNKAVVDIQNDRGHNISAGSKGFYFLTENDPLEFSADWDVRYGAAQTLDGGIYVDGILTSVSMVKIAEGRYYVALSDYGITGTKDMEVIIDATVFDDNNVVTYKKARFTFDGTMWTMDTSADHINKNTVTLTIANDRAGNISSGNKGFYFFSSNNDPLKHGSLTDWSVRYGASQTLEGGVYVDGQLTMVSMIKLTSNRYYIPLSDFGITSKKGMEVVIDATVFDDKNVAIFKKATFVYDGTMWTMDTSEEHANKKKTTVKITNDRTGNISAGDKGFYFLTSNDPLAHGSLTDWSVRYGASQTLKGGVYVDGKLTIVSMIKLTSERYYIPLSDFGITAKKGMEVVIDSTVFDDKNVVTFKKATFVYDGTMWTMDTSAEHANKKKITLEIKNDKTGNMVSGERGFYFYTEEDPLTYNTDWSVKYGASKTYKGGVYVDGKLTIVYLMKIAPSRYYVALSDVGLKAKAGTKVTVDATVFDDKYLATFKPKTFVFDGRMWSMEGEVDTNIVKDLVEIGTVETVDVYEFSKTYSVPVIRKATTAFGSLDNFKNKAVKMHISVNENATELLFGMGKASNNNMWLGDGYQVWLNPSIGIVAIKIGADTTVASGVFDPSGEFDLEFGIVDVENKQGEYYGLKIFVKINGEEAVAWADNDTDRVGGKHLLYYVPGGTSATISTMEQLTELETEYIVDGAKTSSCELVEMPGVMVGREFFYTLKTKTLKDKAIKAITVKLNGEELKKVAQNANSYTYFVKDIKKEDKFTVEIETAKLTTDNPTTIFDLYDIAGTTSSMEMILGNVSDGNEAYHANQAITFLMKLPKEYLTSGYGIATNGEEIVRATGYTFWFTEEGVSICHGLTGQKLAFVATEMFKGGSNLCVESGIVKCYEDGVYKYDRIYLKAGKTVEEMSLVAWYDSTQRGGYASGVLTNGVAEYCSVKTVYTVRDKSANNEMSKLQTYEQMDVIFHKVYYPTTVVQGEKVKIVLYPKKGMKVTSFKIAGKIIKPTIMEDGGYVYVVEKVEQNLEFEYKIIGE